MPSPLSVSHALEGLVLNVRAALFHAADALRFLPSKPSSSSPTLPHSSRGEPFSTFLVTRCYQPAPPRPQGFLSDRKPYPRTTVFHVASGPVLPWSFLRPNRRVCTPWSNRMAFLDEQVHRKVGRGAILATASHLLTAPPLLRRMKDSLRRRDAAKPSPFGVFSLPVGGAPKRPAFRRVALSLEALGGDVVACWVATPPSAFRRPRGLSSSSRLDSLTGLEDRSHGLELAFKGPAGDRHVRTHCPKTVRHRSSSHGVSGPFSVRGNQRRTRGRASQGSTPSPRDVSHVFRGLFRSLPCHHVAGD